MESEEEYDGYLSDTPKQLELLVLLDLFDMELSDVNFRGHSDVSGVDCLCGQCSEYLFSASLILRETQPSFQPPHMHLRCFQFCTSEDPRLYVNSSSDYYPVTFDINMPDPYPRKHDRIRRVVREVEKPA